MGQWSRGAARRTVMGDLQAEAALVAPRGPARVEALVRRLARRELACGAPPGTHGTPEFEVRVWWMCSACGAPGASFPVPRVRVARSCSTEAPGRTCQHGNSPSGMSLRLSSPLRLSRSTLEPCGDLSELRDGCELGHGGSCFSLSSICSICLWGARRATRATSHPRAECGACNTVREISRVAWTVEQG